MNWLGNIIKNFIQGLAKFAPNCRAAIRLQSEALDRKLPLQLRIGLRLHLFLCTWCSRYGKQIKYLRTAAQHRSHDHEPGQTLPTGARERIKQAINAGKGQRL